VINKSNFKATFQTQNFVGPVTCQFSRQHFQLLMNNIQYFLLFIDRPEQQQHQQTRGQSRRT